VQHCSAVEDQTVARKKERKEGTKKEEYPEVEKEIFWNSIDIIFVR
jgi:hypothetical protein